MGLINRFTHRTHRCVFCKKSKGTVYVPDYGIYGETEGNWYHIECLRDIACDPENYASIVVDKAVDILDRVKEEKERNEIIKKRKMADLEQLKKNCEYLKQHCVEIMKWK